MSSRDAAELCCYDVSAMVADARESFEIWTSLFYIDDNRTAHDWADLQWFNPFLSGVENANMSMIIINLFILGDERQKRATAFIFSVGSKRAAGF
jgi:hypothetical protein